MVTFSGRSFVAAGFSASIIGEQGAAVSTITTTRKDLLAMLKATAPVADHRSFSSPLLRALQFSTYRGKATVQASNLSVWRTVPLPGTVAGRQSKVAVLAKQLGAIVKNVVDQDELTLEVDPMELTIRSNGTTLRLPAMPAEDWPAIPVVEGTELALSPTDVARIRQIAPAASHDDARPILTSIVLADGFAVATDSYRLAVARIGVWPSAPLLLPAAIAADLPVDGVTLTVDRAGSRVAWSNGRDFHLAHLVEGDFPKWEQLIPGKPKAVAVAEREPLRRAAAQAVKTNAAMNQSSHPLRLERGDDATLSVVLSSISPPGTLMTAAAPCRKVYKAWQTIAFNAEFLADGLAMLGGDHVRIETIDPKKPALLRDDADKDGDLRYLLMPVRVS